MIAPKPFHFCVIVAALSLVGSSVAGWLLLSHEDAPADVAHAPKWGLREFSVAPQVPATQVPIEHREVIDVAPDEAAPVEQVAAPTAHADQTAVELERLRKRVAWLEIELQLCGSSITTGTVGEWLKMLLPEERPDERTVRLMAEYLRPYPVVLQVGEGLWLAERIREDNWTGFGPTIDEAIILFLGPARIAREVPEERLAELREEWKEEGYFQ